MSSLTNKQRAARYAVAILAATLAACGRGPQETAAPPTPVRTAVAVSGPASPPIEGNGIVATKDEARLSFKVGGVVSRIRVQEGESVRKGQLLAEIEPAEINAQVDATSQLAAKARRDLERGERLYADQVISLEQLEGLRTQAATSQAQLRSAQFNRGYATIVAPRDGVVLRKLVQERELVPAGQPVLALGGRERGYIVRGSLADREIVQVKIGDLAKVSLDAWPGKEFSGRISEVASAADERSGMFPIEVQTRRRDRAAGHRPGGETAHYNRPAPAMASWFTYRSLRCSKAMATRQLYSWWPATRHRSAGFASLF